MNLFSSKQGHWTQVHTYVSYEIVIPKMTNFSYQNMKNAYKKYLSNKRIQKFSHMTSGPKLSYETNIYIKGYSRSWLMQIHLKLSINQE
jgi:hypothetical protein